MQNILPVWKLAESEWMLGQDRKDDPVPIKNTFKSLSTISLNGHDVDNHKGEDSAQRTVLTLNLPRYWRCWTLGSETC